MSDVKMCDNCGTIFSVNAEDWTTFNGTRRRRDPISREYFSESVVKDYCPKCSNRTFQSADKQLNGTVPDDEK